MKIKKIISKIKQSEIHVKAKEHKDKIHQKIKSVLPANERELGKKIEERLTSTNKLWNNLGIAVFSTKSLENITHFSGYILGTFLLILTNIIIIFPTDKKSLFLPALLNNFFVVFATMLILNFLTYATLRIFGSKTTFKVFYCTINTALSTSILIVSIPLALVTFALFSTMLKSQYMISTLFGIIPFYNYLIYGWSAEKLSQIKGIRGVLIALITLLFVLATTLIFSEFLV